MHRSVISLLTAAGVAGGALTGPAATFAGDVLVPGEVSATRPARVVSTTLDATGRPVISVRTATDRETARRYVRDGRRSPRAVAVEIDARVRIAGVPTGADPYRADQWDFAKLGVADAWQRSTGSGVTVAVIDTGVDAAHPDLAGHVLPGIDLVSGATGAGTDPNGHGTHVAGTIAALTGNGIGMSAIAPSATILPIRVLDAEGSGNTSDMATGVVYAADHGADVINLSLGGTTQIEAVTQAIAYARGKGVTVVAAAGNDGTKGSPVSYPGADPGVLAVAATDSGDQVASFSTRGDYVDVAAPGVGILSTRPTAKGSYGTMSGTSMASPHVAAVAALIKAYRPGWTPDEIEQALESTAVDLGATGKDTSFGYGRIDPGAALAMAAPTTTPSPTATPSTSPTPSTGPTPSAGPTPSVTASPTVPARVTPAVAVTSGSRDVVYGATITTRYTVTAAGRPLAGQPVQVCTSAAGAAFTCKAATTTAAGVTTVTVPATGNRRIRLTVPATSTSVAVSSPITAYTIRPKIAVARAAAGKLKITMRGVGGQRIQVQRRTSAGWVQARTYPAAAGRTVTGLVAGASYRVVSSGTAAFTTATSAAVKV